MILNIESVYEAARKRDGTDAMFASALEQLCETAAAISRYRRMLPSQPSLVSQIAGCIIALEQLELYLDRDVVEDERTDQIARLASSLGLWPGLPVAPNADMPAVDGSGAESEDDDGH